MLMCGIAGQLSTSNIKPNTQAAMVALAYHGNDSRPISLGKG